MSSQSAYAASTISSETSSTTDMKTPDKPKPKRSFRQKIKSVLSDIGEPPTAKYDREHGIKPKNLNQGPYGSMASTPIAPAYRI